MKKKYWQLPFTTITKGLTKKLKMMLRSKKATSSWLVKQEPVKHCWPNQ